MKKKREIYWENGKQYLKNTRGSVYEVDGQSVLHNDTTCVLERLDYPKPPISITGFTDVMDFRKYIVDLVRDELNLTDTDMDVMFKKKNSAHMLQPLESDWDKYRNVGALYSNPLYLLETLHCNLFVTAEFSKTHNNLGKNCIVENILRNFHILDMWDKPLKIGDWGAGLGLTTLWMALAFPKSTIYYIEINPATKRIFDKMCKRMNVTNVVHIENLEDLPMLDASVCIEYIEHIPHATKHDCGDVMYATDEVLKYTKSDGIFMYSTKWNDGKKGSTSLGHFSKYDFDGVEVEIVPNTKKPHKTFCEKMKVRGWNILNGNPSKTLWDFKPHRPYVFSKTDMSKIKLLP